MVEVKKATKNSDLDSIPKDQLEKQSELLKE